MNCQTDQSHLYSDLAGRRKGSPIGPSGHFSTGLPAPSTGVCRPILAENSPPESFPGARCHCGGEAKETVLCIHLLCMQIEPNLSVRLLSGRNRTRTCDPIDVNDVYHSGSFAWKNYGGFRHTSEPLSH